MRRLHGLIAQEWSIINTGTPHRMAALQTSSLFPVVQTKEGSGLSLVPAESAGQSETAPGIETVTRAARAYIPLRISSERVPIA